MKSAVKELEEKGKAAKAASKKLAFLSTETKNRALLNIAEALVLFLWSRLSAFVHCDLAFGSQATEHPPLLTLHLIYRSRKESADIFSLANPHQYVSFSSIGNDYVHP